jgi:NitT/TauT family transport system ATP-binding protein
MRRRHEIVPLPKPSVAGDWPLRAEASARAPAIIVHDVVHTFSDGDVLAINRVSLDFQTREFVSIVGPSGCGKTTLLSLIAGLIPLHHGHIEIGREPPLAGRHDIAYMLARDSLLPWRDAIGNVEFGAEMRRMPNAMRRERARHMLQLAGLKGFENAYPKALSQGMRQRVALARTFCLTSPVLLMDEPFGALDAQTKIQLEEVLLNLWTEEQRTVIFVTHDLSEAITLSDRVVVMSARPARVVGEVQIRLPRPRNVRKLHSDPHYHAVYADVWTKLEQGM